MIHVKNFMFAVKQYEKRGMRLYDITFSGGSVKYNYEIDAISGEIAEYERRNAGKAIKTLRVSPLLKRANCAPF